MHRLWYGLLALALVACTSHHSATPAPATSSVTPVVAAPGLPCADPAGAAQRLTLTTPDGPAVGKVDGDRVTTSWSLDQDSVTLGPPPPGLVPAVTRAEAGCALAFASHISSGTVAKGRLELATVTVDPLRTRAAPRAPAYQHRSAWVLVTAPVLEYSCPAFSGPSIAPDPTVRNDPYELIMLDAQTGADLLSYRERSTSCPGFGTTPNSVGTPMQSRSLPWTLVSRNADGGTVVVRAMWRDCDVFSEPIADNGIVLPRHQIIGPGGAFLAAADQDSPTVMSVKVVWPNGACGQAKPHEVTIGPAVAGGPLSAVIQHAAVGLLPYDQ